VAYGQTYGGVYGAPGALVFDAGEFGLVHRDPAVAYDFPLINPHLVFRPTPAGGTIKVVGFWYDTDGNNWPTEKTALSRKAWFVKDGAAVYSTDATVHASSLTGWRYVYQPKRTRARFTAGGLEYEQTDIVHRSRGVMVSRLRVKNTGAAPRTIVLFPYAQPVEAPVTRRGDGRFFSEVPDFGYVTAKFSAAEQYETNAAAFFGAGGDAAPAAVVAGSLSNTGASSEAVCCAGRSTRTIAAGATIEEWMLVAHRQNIYGPLQSESDMAADFAAIEAAGVSSFVDAEIAAIDGWANALAVNTPDAKMNAYVRFALANVHGTLAHNLVDPTLQFFFHGGAGGAEHYHFSTLHQSYPLHYVFLALGDTAPVKAELRSYARQQGTGSALAVRLVPDYAGTSSIPYGSTYTELMFSLCLHQYLSFSQDFAFLSEMVNGLTILARAEKALEYVYAQRVNGSVSGYDWHDGFPLLGSGSEVAQGSQVFILAAEKLAELETRQGNAAKATLYAGWASDMRAHVQSVFYNAAGKFYRRLRVGGAWKYDTIETCFSDASIWAVLAGLTTDRAVIDLAYARRAGPYNAPRTSNASSTAYGPYGQFYGEHYVYHPFSEKFFEWAKAESIVDRATGSTAGADRVLASWVCPFDRPETGRVSYYPENSTTGAYTWSADGEILRWLIGEVIGAQVALDGSVTVDPAMPSAWGDASASIVVGGTLYATSAVGGAVPLDPWKHRLRIEAGGDPVYATLVPGVDLPPAAATTGAGAIAIGAQRSVPPASATSGAGAVALAGAVPVPSAMAVSAAGTVSWPGMTFVGHWVRVEAGGAPAAVLLVPGVDVPSAAATSGAGAITWRVYRPGTGHTIRLRLRDLSPVVDLFSLSCRVRLADRSPRLTLSARKEE
jgi:hypothetical protein